MPPAKTPVGMVPVRDQKTGEIVYHTEAESRGLREPSKIATILGSAKRKYKIGGEVMEEADPRAQLIIRSLKPEDQEIINSMIGDARNPKVLGSGFDHVVLDLGNNKVMRLGRLPQHAADSKYTLKPSVSRTVGPVGVEIYPRLDTTGITESDVQKVQAGLANEGLTWDDAATDNLARDENGDLKIIDGQVRRKSAIPPPQ